MTPSAMLASAGAALYGPRWRKPLAAALDVDERQIRRWLANRGRLSPEHGIFADILSLLSERQIEISQAADAIERWRTGNL